jgi:diguanylate cyclase (GGDEF)-like protein
LDWIRRAVGLRGSLLAVLLTLALPAAATAATGPVSYRSGVAVAPAGAVGYLQDPGGRLTVQQVSAPGRRFTPIGRGTVNFGFSRSAWWLHLTLQSRARTPTTVYLSIAQPTLDDAQLYVFQDGMLRQSVRSGDLIASRERVVPGSHPLLPVHVDPGVRYELYLRVASRMGALLVPLQFQSTADVQRGARLSLLVNGGYTGLFIALFLYNLFLSLSLRERAYAYYVLMLPLAYLACTALDGFGSWMLYPAWVWPGNQGLAMFAGLGLLLNVLFTRALLETPVIRWVDRLLLVTGAGAAVAALAAWLAPDRAYPLCFALALLCPLAGALAGAVCLWRGHPQARFYLGAQLCGAAGLLVMALTVAGALPFSILGRDAMAFGGALQALLFSFALADRIRALQLATRHAQNATRHALESRQQELERSVEQRTRELEEARRHAEYLATTDALTGVYNRRGVLPLVQQAIARAVRHATPLSLVSFDLDRFKDINDSFGHAEGDRVLCQLVSLTRQLVQPSDLLGRTGGEEFLLMLGLPCAQAVQVAERLRAHLQKHLSAGSERRTVTASFGVAGLSRRLASLDALQRGADAALYRAKNHGGNCVETYEVGSNETSRTRAIMRAVDLAARTRESARLRPSAAPPDAPDQGSSSSM